MWNIWKVWSTAWSEGLIEKFRTLIDNSGNTLTDGTDTLVSK